MDIAYFRDLVIIIWGIIAIIVFILIGLLAWMAFMKVKEIGESAKKVTGSVQEVVDSVKSTADDFASLSSFARSEIAEPLIKVAALTQGLSRGLNTILGFFKGNKGGERCA